MAIKIYACITDMQDHDKQIRCVQEYVESHGMSEASVHSIIHKKVAGTASHRKRIISTLVNSCGSGDIVLVPNLSKLAIELKILVPIITEACSRGVAIIQCKDGVKLENQSENGKALLKALGLAAEIGAAIFSQRTQPSLDVIKAKHARGEVHVSKAGNVCTHLGREKGCDNSKATAASAGAKKCRAIVWRENNVGYNSVRRWFYEGRSNESIINEFNELHARRPKDFSTYKGGELTLSILYKWKNEFKLLKNIIWE